MAKVKLMFLDKHIGDIDMNYPCSVSTKGNSLIIRNNDFEVELGFNRKEILEASLGHLIKLIEDFYAS